MRLTRGVTCKNDNSRFFLIVNSPSFVIGLVLVGLEQKEEIYTK